MCVCLVSLVGGSKQHFKMCIDLYSTIVLPRTGYELASAVTFVALHLIFILSDLFASTSSTWHTNMSFKSHLNKCDNEPHPLSSLYAIAHLWAGTNFSACVSRAHVLNGPQMSSPNGSDRMSCSADACSVSFSPLVLWDFDWTRIWDAMTRRSIIIHAPV